MAAGEDKSRQVDKDIRSENSRRVDLTAAAQKSRCVDKDVRAEKSRQVD